MDMGSFNYCIWGTKAWVMIHPGDSNLFMQRLGRLVNKRMSADKMKCFMRNKEYFFHISDLDKLGARYTIVFQKPGDLIVTLPSVIHSTANFSILNINSCKT